MEENVEKNDFPVKDAKNAFKMKDLPIIILTIYLLQSKYMDYNENPIKSTEFLKFMIFQEH